MPRRGGDLVRAIAEGIAECFLVLIGCGWLAFWIWFFCQTK